MSFELIGVFADNFIELPKIDQSFFNDVPVSLFLTQNRLQLE